MRFEKAQTVSDLYLQKALDEIAELPDNDAKKAFSRLHHLSETEILTLSMSLSHF